MSEIYFSRAKNKMSSKIILIVEGPDDAFFLDPILQDMEVSPQEVEVCLARGKSKIEDLIAPMLKSSAFTSGAIERYAIIRDADDSNAAASSEIGAMMSKLGEPTPPIDGSVLRPDGRKVGLFLFPGGGLNGDLETLCLSTLEQSPLLSYAQSFVKNAPEGAHSDHVGKRVTQAFLAIGSSPMCAGAGWAMKKSVFNAKSNALDGLRTFLTDFIS